MESFDVFDTVLTRSVGDPESVFLLMGSQLVRQSLIQISPPEFARLRVRSESRARSNCGWNEVSIEVIYDELANEIPLSKVQRDELIRRECETEKRLLRAVPGAVEKTTRARQRNGSVIYISDMYLPRPFILGLLEHYGLWQQGDRLYLSNEEGASKASGRLFRRVLEKENLPADCLIHRGNHPHGDRQRPAEMGIRPEPFPEGNTNRYENLMVSYAHSTLGLSSVLAGASRLARLSTSGLSRTEQTLLEVTAGVMAPTLVGFVLWVLRKARERDLKRLYFLSRDGQILLEIARRLAPKLNYDIDLRYLYASRQSWHLPAITRIDASNLEWICMQFDSLSVRSLLFRVGVHPEEVALEIAKAGLKPPDFDRQLTSEELESVKALLSAGPLHDLILSRASEKRRDLLGYLSQEGLYEDVPWALIDIGWNGRLQASLGKLLASLGRPPPTGFYFSLASRPDGAASGTFEGYLFDPSRPESRSQLSRVDVPTLLEMACAADHGTVEEFGENNGHFGPILRHPDNTPAIQWGLSVMQDTVCRFVDHLFLNDELVDVSQDLRPMSIDLMRTFWENPTTEEAEAWGGFPFENDQSGTAIQPIARPYDTRAVVQALLGRKRGNSSVSFWHDGSVMISPPAVRLTLKLGAQIKRLFRKQLSMQRG